jgi:hypothetical protein
MDAFYLRALGSHSKGGSEVLSRAERDVLRTVEQGTRLRKLALHVCGDLVDVLSKWKRALHGR